MPPNHPQPKFSHMYSEVRQRLLDIVIVYLKKCGTISWGLFDIPCVIGTSRSHCGNRYESTRKSFTNGIDVSFVAKISAGIGFDQNPWKGAVSECQNGLTEKG